MELEAFGIVFLVAVVGTMGYVVWLRRKQDAAADATIKGIHAANAEAVQALEAAGQALVGLDETLQAGLARLGEQPTVEQESFFLSEQQRALQRLGEWLQASHILPPAVERRTCTLAELWAGMEETLSARSGPSALAGARSREYGLAFDTSALVLAREPAMRDLFLAATPSSKTLQESCRQEWLQHLARPIYGKQTKASFAPHAGLFSYGVGAH